MKTLYTIIYRFNGCGFSTAHSSTVSTSEEAIKELKTLLGDNYNNIEIEDISSRPLTQGRV
jgi:hypothetical protein